MARTIRDSNLESRTARSRLTPRGRPYYRNLEPGLLHLGYRKPLTGAGKWLARVYVGNGAYRLHKIGVADDYSDADGRVILSFKQAQAAARKLMVTQAGGGIGTVADAIEDYIRALEMDGRSQSAIKRTRYNAAAFILPALGHIELAKLTVEQVQRWRDELARCPARVRTSKGEKQRFRERSDDPDAVRARRATVNRIRTTLAAALNRAFQNGHVSSDRAWRRVKLFKGVDRARTRYLTIDEGRRLINACEPAFRLLVQAALLTGARYGSLIQLVASDFNPDAAVLRLHTRKGDGSEKIFFTHLSDEGLAFFRAACAGKRGADLMFVRDDRRPWGKSHQEDRIRAASERARISPPVNFHALRHTYCSHSVMAGCPLMVLAASLGHVNINMVQKHYGHLAPSYAAEQIRRTAPRYGIKPGNVRPLHGRA
jgi:integrase